MCILILAALGLFLPGMTFPQAAGAPKREIRAVWIATLPGHDWPASEEPGEQQRSLLEIIQKLRSANFNTILFQVRGRADAMYVSRFEPWSQALTGTLGGDPGWDPLAFMIREAHARGMEVHAWFNTFLAKTSGAKYPPTIPLHVTLGRSELLKETEGEVWFDPGLPAAREYLARVAMDIVRHYDVDGIHFDYLRYPQKSFPDEPTYRRYGRGISRDDWRRENINEFLRAFRDSLSRVKPFVKVGSAPIGIYKNTGRMRGLQSYWDLFQDSRRWLREGLVDYIAPQVYWPLGASASSPDFAAMVREWSENTSGRHVYIGIGAYKPEVFVQIPRLIDSTRAAGMPGNCFFRYESIAEALDVGGRYSSRALIPPMSWKDSVPPNPPRDVRVANVKDDIFSVQWTPPVPAPDGDTARSFAIYRSAAKPIDAEDGRNLLAVALPEEGTCRYTDTIRHASSPTYFYAVSSLDRLNNESSPAVESVTMPEIVELARRYAPQTRMGTVYPVHAASVLFIPYEIGARTAVVLKILDSSSRELLTVVDAVEGAGSYIASADVSRLPEGAYTSLLVAGESSQRQTFRVDH